MVDKFSLLQKTFDKGNFTPFIKEITFPFFKNMTKGSRIEFSHPITALVGANGSSKSSVLHALYGAPSGKNIGDFWFSTAIDPIEESDERNCYFYKYFNLDAKRDVEVLIQRSPYRKGGGDPDYWESSRPVIDYGMEPYKVPKNRRQPGGSKTRWNMISKPVLHIDFRSALPAFDKFFYHDAFNSRNLSQKNKKDKLRRTSLKLKTAIEENLTADTYYNKQKISEPVIELSKDLVSKISLIIGKKYNEVKLIKHSYFECNAYTATMKVDDLKYTEAFAGSGEFSAIYLVYKISNAEPGSLILLDEPEVSLHPGAQEKIIEFIAEECLKKRHQVVFTTHSPALIRPLPKNSIKVLGIDPATNKTKVITQSAHSAEAFFHIGEKSAKKIKIIVEDRLAKIYVERALKRESQAINRLIDINFYPGGVSVLWNHYIPACAIEDRQDVLFLLDGDMRPTKRVPKENSIAKCDEEHIPSYLHSISHGHYSSIPIDGGSTELKKTNKIRNDRILLSWSERNVNHLPGNKNPECLLWAATNPETYSDAVTADDAKLHFESYTRRELDLEDAYPSSEEIFHDQKRLVAHLPDGHQDLAYIHEVVMNFFNERTTS